MYVSQQHRKRNLNVTILSAVSGVGSLSTLLFGFVFAFLHDEHAPLEIQVCFLVAAGVAFIVAVMSLLIASVQS